MAVKKTDLKRRAFMQKSGLALAGGYGVTQLPPVERLVDMMIHGFISKAQAGTSVGNYVLINLAAAPGRWTFDQWLNFNGESITPALGAANVFTSANGQVNGAVNRGWNYNGKFVSPIFSTQVATASGTRPFSDLLPNMLAVRGYGTGIDGHPTNNTKQTNPRVTAGSISGNVADNGSSLFKAIQFPVFGGWNSYNSIGGTGITVPPYPDSGAKVNYIDQLLSPFSTRTETGNINNTVSRYRQLIDNAQASLAAAVSNDRPDFKSVEVDKNAAIAKIKEGIGNLTDAWPGLFTKYQRILKWPYSDRSAPGYTADAIITGPAAGSGAESHYNISIGAAGEVPVPGQDMRDFAGGIYMDQIATSFALCEFAMTQGLTNAFELLVNQPPNGILYQAMLGGTPTAVNRWLEFDQHGMGVISAIYLNSCLYRGIGGAILELVEQLKKVNLFQNTSIHIVQDFGRTPRDSGGGADHGYNAMIASVISGKISGGPYLAGNILSNGTGGDFGGGWGQGCYGRLAPTKVGGNTVTMIPDHVCATLAVLLNFPSNPWSNEADPLLVFSGGGLQLNCEAKVVAA